MQRSVSAADVPCAYAQHLCVHAASGTIFCFFSVCALRACAIWAVGLQEGSTSACRFDLTRITAQSVVTMRHQEGPRYVLRGLFSMAVLLSYTAALRTLLQGEIQESSLMRIIV
jgi:hypothetical protein